MADELLTQYKGIKADYDQKIRKIKELGAVFLRVGKAMAESPDRVLINTGLRHITDSSQFAIVPDQKWPTLDEVAQLADETREVGTRLAELKRQLRDYGIE